MPTSTLNTLIIILIIMGAATHGLQNPNLDQCKPEVAAPETHVPPSISKTHSIILPADVDGDGSLDIVSVLSNFPNRVLEWNRNTDNGNAFAAPLAIDSSLSSVGNVVVVDIDGDGDRDVLITLPDDNTMAWYRNNNGLGSFSSQIVIDASISSPRGCVVINQDIVVAARGANTVLLYPNTDGLGTFGAPQTLASGIANLASVFAHDIDGDGLVDIVSEASAFAVDSELYVLTGTGTGYDPPISIDIPSSSRSIDIVADINGDTRLDFVGGSNFLVFWLENTGTTPLARAFVTHQVTSFVGVSTPVSVADMDGDGTLDILAQVSTFAGLTQVTYSYWAQNSDGKGSFGPGNLVSTKLIFGTADMTNNGLPDAILEDQAFFNENIYVQRNAYNVVSFPPPTTVESATLPFGRVLAADIDGDGDKDIVTDVPFPSWRENLSGTGTFGPPAAILSNAVSIVDIVDMDSDGDLDVVIGLANAIVWAENTNGKGIFSSFHSIDSLLAQLVFLFIQDWDNDGDMDAFYAESNIGGPQLIFRINTDGVFDSAPIVLDHVLDANPYSQGLGVLDVADINGDGFLDLLSCFRNVTWFRHNGTGPGLYFVQQIVAPLPGGEGTVSDVASGHIDQDPYVDIVVSTSTGALRWFPNTAGTGDFAPSVSIRAPDGETIKYISLADVDATGSLDVVTTSTVSLDILWFANNGLGSFSSSATIATPFDPTCPLVLADIDVDGDPDVIAMSSTDGTVTFFNRQRATFNDNRPPTTRTLPPSSSFIDLATALGASSRCTRDTILLPPGNYSCRHDSHFDLTFPARIAATPDADPVHNPVVFECDEHVLFHPTADPTSPSSVGDLELVGLTIRSLGTAPLSSVGSPGLRADGAGAALSLVNCTLENGIARSSSTILAAGVGGCALAVNGGSITLRSSTIRSCSSSVGGGVAARSSGSSLTLVDSSVEGNTAGLSGGGVAVLEGASLTAVNSDLSSNTAATFGGGLLVDESSSASLSISRVVGNSAADDGGGIAVTIQSVVDLDDACEITHNTAGTVGGGLSVRSGASLSGTHIVIAHNSAVSLGGGVWVEPSATATLVSTQVDANTAAAGGGLAAASVSQTAFATGSVGDVPVVVTYVPLGFAEPALNLSDVVLTANTASKWGGGLYACDAHVTVSDGPASAWTLNVASRSIGQQVQSSADMLLCPALDFEPQISSSPPILPWVSVPPGLASSLAIHGPPAKVEWVTLPPETVEAGGILSGSIRVLDWFGQPVVYSDVLVETSVTPSLALAPLDLPPVLMFSETVALPVASLGVTDTSLAPANLELTIGVAPGQGLSVIPATTDVLVGPCSVGRGGVVSDGITDCFDCPEGTRSDSVSFDPCLAPPPPPPCPDNTLRIVANASTDPCICSPGFWEPNGGVDVPCVACPVGGVCAGGVAKPSAAPGFFPDATDPSVYLACPNSKACLGSGQCQRGYVGRLCGQCAEGYYALRGACFACKPGVNTVVTLVFVLAGLILSGAVLVFNLAEGVRYRFGAAMIGISSLQVSAMYVAFYLTGVLLCCVVCCVVLCVVLCCVCCGVLCVVCAYERSSM